MKLIFATNNNHKLLEIKSMLDKFPMEILSLKDIGFNSDIEETGTNFSENALLKAKTIYTQYNLPVFADDSGLVIDALNGEPGIFSARYAGAQRNDHDNMNKVLNALADKRDRTARFVSMLAYISDDGQELFFEGTVEGVIATEKTGEEGFGYDPIFIPEGYNISFAEMGSEAKNKISHRKNAVKKLVQYFETQF